MILQEMAREHRRRPRSAQVTMTVYLARNLMSRPENDSLFYFP